MKVHLRSSANRPNTSEDKPDYANFSQTRIITLFQVPQYEHLQILICNGNSLTTLAGVENIKNLWKLDVSNNQIRSLQHLSRFIALGSLNLSNNNLSWIELQHIRHMFILDLRVDGNVTLDADPNYRQHVLDCLPRVWMCDGLFVSTVERNQIDEFFTQSSLTTKPVRRKLARDIFMPTNLKDRSVNGLFGTKATELFAKFPMNCFVNPELDRKRIKHLASTIQDILSTELKHNQEKQSERFLNENRHILYHLIELRQTHIEQFNMILILLITDILFHIPVELLDDALNITHIKSIGNLNVPHLFLSSEQVKCTIASLVHAGARVDRDENHPSAFYEKLFQSLSMVLTSEVRQLSQSSASATVPPAHLNATLLAEAKSLVCLEVMQVLIMCPVFYTLMDNSNVNAILKQALERSPAYGSIRDVLQNLETEQKTGEQQRDLLSPILSNILKMTIRTLTSKRMKKVYESPGLASDVTIPETISSNKSQPEIDQTSQRTGSRFAAHRVPTIGDRILTAPQCFGRIVTLPDADLAMVQLDNVLAVNGSMISNGNLADHTTYVTIHQFEWSPVHEYWKPKHAAGDRVTLHMTTASFDTPRPSVMPIVLPDSLPAPSSPLKTTIHKTPQTSARRSTTPKLFDMNLLEAKEPFVGEPPTRTHSPAPSAPSADQDAHSNSQVLSRTPPPSPPPLSIEPKVIVCDEKTHERPMAVRIIKQKQDKQLRNSLSGESFSSPPVLIESMLLLMPDQSQQSVVSCEQMQPSLLTSSHTVQDFDQSSAIPSISPTHRRTSTANTHRVHVPVHNASQWFNGPDLQNERTGRMEKVVASLIRRPFRPASTYGIARTPMLSSPSSKDHAYYRGVRPESYQDFHLESHRLTPVLASSNRQSPVLKGRYGSSSPMHHYSSNRNNDSFHQNLFRVKSLLNPPRSTPAWM